MTTTCFETGFAVLLDINMWKLWGDIITPLIAIFAVIVAIRQLKSSKIESRSSTANSIYHSYLNLCLANPELAKGKGSITKANDNYGSYCWFISSMLFSFEKIIESVDSNEKWESTIKSQLERHKEFLKNSRTAKSDEWDNRLKKLIDSVVN